MPRPPRSTEQRQRDVLALLESPSLTGWVDVATGDAAERLPVAAAWIDQSLVLAVPREGPVAAHLTAHDGARLRFGPADDPAVIDVALERVVTVRAADRTWKERFPAPAAGGPRLVGHVFMVCEPTRIQVWRDDAEIPGRTVMLRGVWKA